jgi:hypothetical protein
VLTGDIAGVGVLASTKVEVSLIPWLFGFAGLIILLLLGCVFFATMTDPSRLMLGQITGTEYANIRRITLGDSDSGRRARAPARSVF